MTTTRGRTFKAGRSRTVGMPQDPNGWKAHYEWEALGRVCGLCGDKVNSNHYCFGCHNIVCDKHKYPIKGRHKMEAHA